MHVKTLVIDGKVLLTGSVNLTHNGFEKNKEHLYRITDPSAIREVLDDFEKDWEGPEVEEVSEELMQEVMKAYDAKETQKEQARIEREGRSRSKSRSVSRSLSAELAETEEGFETPNKGAEQ